MVLGGALVGDITHFSLFGVDGMSMKPSSWTKASLTTGGEGSLLNWFILVGTVVLAFLLEEDLSFFRQLADPQ